VARKKEEGDGIFSLEYYRAMDLLDWLGETMGERPWELESAAREVRVATEKRDIARLRLADANLLEELITYERLYG
jgi:hypothetical protein